mmetsp:Transcript_59361/g.141526  ORF Transcript_59361/g.141526 Transcript_59361/m.141526 type:complete len:167 (-) Transcript_59361:91-591(-)|eukprot:CAMPEP_0178421000 /NCGR_PEP_ID=MMETSP0689_2-20121128/26424_1 /TAXON_ID=160604 /ORGANISM="Amphidinium massartii, Strain CS-259" /LENGTH=166 /DNA_ID=CAMNT_0020042503 /DNA_START=81 /DNA_END=581 /DNA_ORIENTATION=+
MSDSFAEFLTRTVAEKRIESRGRTSIAAKWTALEERLLDIALDLFKQRCMKEAEAQRSEASISFEVLSREISGFPQRVLKDNTYYVESWGDCGSAEPWLYASKGTSQKFTADTPVVFADVLEGMMPKFLEKVKTLGFNSANREKGTWKVAVKWGAEEEPSPKKKRS